MEIHMANPLLALEVPSQPSDQLSSFNMRQAIGHTLLVVAGQFAVVGLVLMLWIYRDLNYTPGWAHPISFYCAIASTLTLALGMAGWVLRRGTARIG
jgi:hypothetical protein